MSTTHIRSETPEAGHAPVTRRRTTWVVVLAGVAVLAVLAVVAGVFLRGVTREIPQFDSLARTPDPTIGGTVAYFQDATSCVRVVAAAGQPSEEVLCLEDQDVTAAMKLGKLVGPQLVWREDDRLEITMFRLTDPPGPTFEPGWQKVVDVRTGVVEETPAVDLPTAADTDSQPTVSPDGRRVEWSSEAGRIEVVLQEPSGPRTLLSAQGPDDHSYALDGAFWSPTWQWVAADDGRILVITTVEPAVTRVLTEESTMGGYGGYPRFAVTAADLLTSAG